MMNRTKQTMTVEELIEALQKFPKDMRVLAEWESVHAGIRLNNFAVENGELIIDVNDY